MTDDKLRLVKALVGKIPELTVGQLHWLQRVVGVFDSEHNYALTRSDLFDDQTLQNFGDAMRVHHSFSVEPFSKDKFEYVLVQVLNMSGQNAVLAPRGNPGHDATVGSVRLSLKTQADRSIKPNSIWISKFMELGKGQWTDNLADLNGLRQQFLNHMGNYDRILTLRTLSKGPQWEYELVEIPKVLLQRAATGTLEIMSGSKQMPKPGYCHVHDSTGRLLYDLYFDGGSERKLQIKSLDKSLCAIHASWQFFIPPE
jgi:hypothetical protein